MRWFKQGTWCERVPARGAAPLMAALTVMGILSHLGVPQHLAGAVGWIWG